MSHHKNEHIVCPNCGFSATRNYCAQCGQETHLHKETFVGLVVHFVAHYFHYDSKFWQTISLLLFKPGKLTVDYWEKKRKRHVPPMSLYILVSAVFFIAFFSTAGSKEHIREVTSISTVDSLERIRKADSTRQAMIAATGSSTEYDESARIREVIDSGENLSSFLAEGIHVFPKFFFFMIPLMACALKILFFRRKSALFADHAIFSLHIHAFVFIMLLLFWLYPVPETGANPAEITLGFIQDILPLGILLYIVLAIKKAYNISWVRSVLYSGLISLGYAGMLTTIIVGYYVYSLYKATTG